MTDATWKQHPTYSGYEVSDDGRVRSLSRFVATRWGTPTWRDGRVLKTFVRAGGYLGGNISDDGERINFEVHKFVCETFHGLKPRPDLQVRHLNGDQLDNRASNLCWGTRSENMQDKIQHGTHHELNKTHCPQGHEYTEANTYRRPGSPNKRQCRTCMDIREAARPPRTHRKAG